MIVFENPLPYDIRISGSANKGFILNAGCCTCVFTDKKEMLDAISDYIDNPKDMEKKYNESNKHARPQVVETGMGGSGVATLSGPMNEVQEDCSCQQEDTGPDERARR